MPFIIAGGVLLLIIIVFFAGTFWVCHKSFTNPKRDSAMLSALLSHYAEEIKTGEDYLLSLPCEDVSITSFDGLTLRGRYIKADVSKRTVIFVHGYQSRGTRDFALAAEFYRSQGCDMLIIDHRACGRSDGKYITFGVKESRDVADWASFISKKAPDLPIYLDGISLGSGTVLMASGLPLPENTVGIISDCGFTSPWDICTHVAKSYFRLPKFPFMYIADLYCNLFAKFSLRKDGKVADALKKNKLPIIFVHGGADNFVPTQMSRDNYAAADCEKEIYIIDGAAHGLSYATDKAFCEEKLISFFERHDGSFRPSKA